MVKHVSSTVEGMSGVTKLAVGEEWNSYGVRTLDIASFPLQDHVVLAPTISQVKLMDNFRVFTHIGTHIFCRPVSTRCMIVLITHRCFIGTQLCQ